MKARLLPIGIQDFEDLRKRECIYVDKTAFIYKLAKEGKPYFLSRPRRFGKSLLLSTMEYYFLGKQELFKGLAIEKLEKDWTEYPVLKISFGADNYPDLVSLKSAINLQLSRYEKRYNIEVNDERSAPRLNNIISAVYEQTGKQVVILIDEYDKPILDALYTDYEEQNRQELRSFYSPLKDLDKYIRFLFITGITKISHVNIFSGLNQLNDISLNKDFQTIYPELLNVVKKLAYKWDPTISDESDPGVLLIKLNAIIADKCNYNIDKNVLECFPESVTQEKNARQLFSQLGYSMKWYRSGTSEVSIQYIGDNVESDLTFITLPIFTMLTDSEGSVVYTTTQAATIYLTSTAPTTVPVIEGTVENYTLPNSSNITVANLDSKNRLYFTEYNIAENGIFIANTLTDIPS